VQTPYLPTGSFNRKLSTVYFVLQYPIFSVLCLALVWLVLLLMVRVYLCLCVHVYV
jgi:hypothetical protein